MTETPPPPPDLPPLQLPVLTPRLRLRTHRRDDAEALLGIYSQPAVARYLLDEAWTPTLAAEKTAERLTCTGLDTSTASLALIIECDTEVIGDVTLWQTGGTRATAEIGWVLDPAHSGRGYASEAVAAVLAVAFDHYRLHRVSAQMDARNTASARLARRVGMIAEAHLRQDWWSKGEWTDTLIFGMLADDRLAGTSSLNPGT